MSVVDLATGRPINNVEEHAADVLVALKSLVRRIEERQLNIESFYLIADGFTADSGVTAGGAIALLEREKFRVLCMLENVKL